MEAEKKENTEVTEDIEGVEKAEETNRFLKHKKLTLTIFIIISIIILDLAAGYIFLAHPADHPIRVSSPYYNHDLVPMMSVKEQWGLGWNDVVTNSLGFKDNANRIVPLETKNHRILFIGDSFTEGIGVNYDNTFVGRIEKGLKSRNTDVLNAGVSSYSPKLYYLKTKYWVEHGLKIDELVVFIDLSDVQDELAYEDWTPTTPDSWRTVSENVWHKIDFYLEHHSMLYLHGLRPILLGSDKRKLNALFFGGGMVTAEEAKYLADRGRWTIDDTVWNDWGKSGVDLELENMGKLYDFTKARGIKLSIAVYPWPVSVLSKDLNSRQVKIWQDFTTKNKINFYNFFPEFIATSTASQDVVKNYYIPGDNHWNEAGHEVIASGWLKQYLGGK